MSTETQTIPDAIMRAAEKTLDQILCNCPRSCGGLEGVRAASIVDIAKAINDAVMAERERSQWRPIQSAPRTIEYDVLVYGSDSRMSVAFWSIWTDGRPGSAKREGWFESLSKKRLPNVTHWMPLPAAPKAEG
ncbi:DUF551 domain-containing protein [Shinella sp.]|uniref:DUF551 domain-containing protein n=1 Tax=Shinella sp. TaxID=1870904 RepID=UPI0029A9FED8|nr:DUF551 domain-containing protein [Shinella sp.]MDX3973264.1 DUF551 domain-containing protein [Shinella sp.]